MTFLNTVFTNTRTKIIFNLEHPDDVDTFARKTGQVVISSYSSNTSRDANSPFAIKTTYGDSEYDKHNIHSNIFLLLPFGKSVIFRRGKLATLANHSHLVSKAEKENLERSPYPEPERVQKHGVMTAAQEIERMKRQILEWQRQNQGQGNGQPRQRPGQNAGIEVEDIAM